MSIRWITSASRLGCVGNSSVIGARSSARNAALLLAACGLTACGDPGASFDEPTGSIPQLLGDAIGGLATANPWYQQNVDSYPELAGSHLPLLHSNPNAGAVIFMDFDGGTYGDGTTYAAFDYEHVGTSASTNTIGLGIKSFSTSMALGIGSRVRANAEHSVALYMEGTVTGLGVGPNGPYWGIDMDNAGGSGTYGDWVLHDVTNPKFSPAERTNILEQWREAAMFFSMFNVDVTTEEPTFGQKPITWAALTYNDGGLGGSFPEPSATASATVSDQAGPNTNTPHEVGHSFGLSHSGDFDPLGIETNEYGSQSSSPLYTSFHGTGAQQVDHMPKWVYKIGGTYGSTPLDPALVQDDVAVIASSLFGAGVPAYLSDDIGNTRATAANISAIAPNIWGSYGTLNALTDVDYLKFQPTVNGYYSIMVGRDAPTPVDTAVEIENSTGTMLASLDGNPSSPTPTNNVYDQHLTRFFSAGTYYIKVFSHGNLGDIGQYVVRANLIGDASNPWQVKDVGVNGVPGYSIYDSNGGYQVLGSGRGISDTRDGLGICYQRLVGDGTISARVTALDGSNGWAKSGITIRESLDPGARHVTLSLTKDHGWNYVSRGTTGGNSSSKSEAPDGAKSFAAKYLKIARSGQQFTLYVSSSGTSWGSPIVTLSIPMSSTRTYIGLVSSGEGDRYVEPLTGWTFSDLVAERLTSGTLKNVSLAATGTGRLNPPEYSNVDTTLAAPVLSVDTIGSDGIGLTWSALGYAVDYILESSEDNINWIEEARPRGVPAITDLGLDDFRRYYYRLRGRSSGGVSPPSAVVSAVTRAGAVETSAIRTFSLNQKDIALYWDDVDGESGYRIHRSTSPSGTYQLIGSVPKNKRFFLDDTAKMAGKNYFYRLETLDPSGSSVQSVAVAGKTRWTDASPGGPVAIARTTTSISLEWSDFSAGGVTASSYSVYRLDGVQWTLVGTPTTSSFTDTGLSRGTTYTYQVVACNTSTAVYSGASVPTQASTSP